MLVELYSIGVLHTPALVTSYLQNFVMNGFNEYRTNIEAQTTEKSMKYFFFEEYLNFEEYLWCFTYTVFFTL